MKNTQFNVEDVFTDVISKDSISQEQISKLNNVLSKNDVNINIKPNFNFFKPKKNNNIDYQPSAPPYYE